MKRRAFMLILLIAVTPFVRAADRPSRIIVLRSESTGVAVDALAPQTTQVLGYRPGQPSSCYYSARVSLVPRTSPGFWGLRMDLASPGNLFEGGLNFGGAITANGRGEAYVRFRIDNVEQQAQLFALNVDIQFPPVYDPSRLGIEAQLFELRAGSNRFPIDKAQRSIPAGAAQRHQIRMAKTLAPGYYLVSLRSLPGSAWATFQATAQTSLASQAGGGFAGSAEVGGYLTHDLNGISITGYAGLCVSTTQEVRFTTIRNGLIGALILRIVDAAGNTLFDSATAPVTTTTTTSGLTTTTISYSRDVIGYGNMLIEFQPNPVVDSGEGRHFFTMQVSETNGVAVNLNQITVDGERQDIMTYFGKRRIEPFESIAIDLLYLAVPPISRPTDVVWNITGADEAGHFGIAWTGTVRMTPKEGKPYGHVEIRFWPNPALPDTGAVRPFILNLDETGGVGVKIKQIFLNGKPWEDVKALLGADTLDPKERLAREYSWPQEVPAGELVWSLKGEDANGHKGLEWSARQSLADFFPLVDGQWKLHAAWWPGFMPFQYTSFVGPNTSSLTIELEQLVPLLQRQEQLSKPGVLSIYVRMGKPVEDRSQSGLPPLADFSVKDKGAAAVVISAKSRPPLEIGQTYYTAVFNSDKELSVPYNIRSRYELLPTTSTVATSSTTSTIKTATTTTVSVSSTTTIR